MDRAAQEQIGWGVFWILLVALLQILGGIYSLWFVFTHEPSSGATGSASAVTGLLKRAFEIDVPSSQATAY